MPWLSRRALVCGLASAARTSSPSLLTTVDGVRAGATMAHHWLICSDGSLASAAVGTLGSAGMRAGPVTINAVILPAPSRLLPLASVAKWPATSWADTSVSAGAEPR